MDLLFIFLKILAGLSILIVWGLALILAVIGILADVGLKWWVRMWCPFVIVFLFALVVYCDKHKTLAFLQIY
jgi:hypothetical protein